MEYLIGLASGLVLFALLAGSYLIGARRAGSTKTKAAPLTEEEKRRAEQLQKEFQEVMSYNVEKARGGVKLE